MIERKELTWKDVFNPEGLKHTHWVQSRESACRAGYEYIAYESLVYHVTDFHRSNPITTTVGLCGKKPHDARTGRGYKSWSDEKLLENYAILVAKEVQGRKVNGNKKNLENEQKYKEELLRRMKR